MDKIDFDCLTERTKTRVSEISLTEFNYAQILCTSNHALISQTATPHPSIHPFHPLIRVPRSFLVYRRVASWFVHFYLHDYIIRECHLAETAACRLVGGSVYHLRPANLIMHAFYDYPKTKGNENLIAIKLNPNIFSSFDMGCFH